MQNGASSCPSTRSPTPSERKACALCAFSGSAASRGEQDSRFRQDIESQELDLNRLSILTLEKIKSAHMALPKLPGMRPALPSMSPLLKSQLPPTPIEDQELHRARRESWISRLLLRFPFCECETFLGHASDSATGDRIQNQSGSY